MRTRRHRLMAILSAAMLIVGYAAIGGPQSAFAANTGGNVEMYRMYNRISHEHLYTKDTNERNVLMRGDWTYEGIGWVAPAKSNRPVYRLYNPILGDHHYTMDQNEVNVLTAKYNWRREGIGWYSSERQEVPVYRQFHGALRVGSHNYTADANEYKVNNSRGWRGEGIAWYAVQANPYLGKQQNILIMGVDNNGERDVKDNAENSDALILMQVSGDRRHISLMSIPRATAAVMPSGDRTGRRGLTMPINMAYQSGPEVEKQAVEQLLGIHIDHWVSTDIYQFVKLIDAANKVKVNGVQNTYGDKEVLVIRGGQEHLANGVEARAFARERKHLPAGDTDRVRRHQQLMYQLHAKIFNAHALADPALLQGIYNLYSQYTKHDAGFTLSYAVDLAYSTRAVASRDIAFYTFPTKGDASGWSSPDPVNVYVKNFKYAVNAQDAPKMEALRGFWQSGTAWEYGTSANVDRLIGAGARAVQ